MILIREGERSVRSMVHEFEVSEQEAADYYIERLEHLVSLAHFLKSRGRPVTLLTFEELTSEREATLDRLGRFLSLDSPLSASFTAAPGASQPGAGDPSGRLNAGQILKTQRELSSDLGEETRQRLAAAHERATAELRATVTERDE